MNIKKLRVLLNLFMILDLTLLLMLLSKIQNSYIIARLIIINFFANNYLKILIYSFAKDIVYHKMKNLISNANMKFLAKSIILETLEQFFLNHINKLLYKVARFIKFLIRIVTNIVVGIFNINFIFFYLIYDNKLSNIAI